MRNDEGFGPNAKKTYREDGSLATVVDGNRLIQYDKKGSVSFVEEINSNTKITYRNGQVAAMEKESVNGQRNITLYNDKGHITTSIALGKNDQVNFTEGYLSSVIKHNESGLDQSEIVETQYGKNGQITSSTHKVRLKTLLGGGMWITTQHATYHENGKLSSVVTYKQCHKQKNDFKNFSLLDNEEADSYCSSITQYDENGKTTVSLRLNENDDVNYNGDRVASVTRRDEHGNPLSSTLYNEDGSLASITNYGSDGKIVSSINYENGRPVSGRQEGTEKYQDIFSSRKDTEYTPETHEKITLIKNKKIKNQAETSLSSAKEGMAVLSENVKSPENTPLTLISIAETSDHIGQKYPELTPQEVDILSDVVVNPNVNQEVTGTVSEIADGIKQRLAEKEITPQEFLQELKLRLKTLLEQVEMIENRLNALAETSEINTGQQTEDANADTNRPVVQAEADNVQSVPTSPADNMIVEPKYGVNIPRNIIKQKTR